MAHIKWGSSSNLRCLFDCPICETRWVASSEVSTCLTCKHQLERVTDTRFRSRIVRKTSTEQLGFGQLLAQ